MAGVWQRCVGVPAGSKTVTVNIYLPCCRWEALLLDLLLVESTPSAGPGARVCLLHSLWHSAQPAAGGKHMCCACWLTSCT